MQWLKIFRCLFKRKLHSTNVNLKNENVDYDPEGHHRILDYMRSLRRGGEVDEEFENMSLRNDLRMNSLNLAALFFHVAHEHHVPMEKTIHFLRVGLDGGGDPEIATLMERIDILAVEFSESEYLTLLSSGVVGDQQEIVHIRETVDSVGFIVKFCHALSSLSDI